MKKNRKRFAALVLAFSMMLSSLPVTAFADETPAVTEVTAPVSEAVEVTAPAETEAPPAEPQTRETTVPAESETEPTVSGETTAPTESETEPAVSEETAAPAESETEPEEADAGNSGIMPASLLPLEKKTVFATIDRTMEAPTVPEGGSQYAVTPHELFSQYITENPGEITTDAAGNFNGKLLYTLGTDDMYIPIGWNDTITLSEYFDTVYFIVGNGDQLSMENTYYDVHVEMNFFEREVLEIVTLDRTEGIPAGLEDKGVFSFYVKEVLNALLERDGFLDSSGNFTGEIGYQDGSYSVDYSRFKKVTLNDALSINYANDTLYFYVAQQGKAKKMYTISLIMNYLGTDFVKGMTFDVYNDSGEKVHVATSYSIPVGTGSKYYRSTVQVSSAKFGEEEIPGCKIVLSEGYSTSNVKIYEGRAYNSSELSALTDITSQIIDGVAAVPYKTKKTNDDYGGYTYYGGYEVNLTYAVTLPDGSISCIPVEYYIDLYSIDWQVSMNNYSSYSYQIVYNDIENKEEYSYIPVIESDYGYGDVRLCFSASYQDYFGEDSTGETEYSPDKIAFASYGNYASQKEAEAAGETDIKEQLFVMGYRINKPISDFADKFEIGYLEDGREVKISTLELTIIDIYGFVYHRSIVVGLAPAAEPAPAPVLPEEDEPEKSTITTFNILGANKFGESEIVIEEGESGKKEFDAYIVGAKDDSYVNNGYQTVFILDDGESIPDGSTIYPTYNKINEKSRAIMDTGTEQIVLTNQNSGQLPILLKSGKALPVTVGAENDSYRKNYWVTYVTRQPGVKLFVNGTNFEKHYSDNNKPQREILLAKTGNIHDIFIANIGSEQMNNINVSLSSDTQGVKLDDYWTVIDSSVRTLAPFTSARTRVIDNIAKIRLVPKDDGFGPISGTLTISYDGGSQEIELTGIAGKPEITMDTLYGGVKYVPYSCVVLTNNMYGGDVLEFSATGLPRGMEITPNGEIKGVPLDAGTFYVTVTAKYTGTFDSDFDSSADYSCQKTFMLYISDNSDDSLIWANDPGNQGYAIHESDSLRRTVTIYYSGTDMGDDPYEYITNLANNTDADTDNQENNAAGIDNAVSDYDIYGESDVTDTAPDAEFEFNIENIELENDLFWSEAPLGEFKALYLNGKELTKDTDFTQEEGSTKNTVKAQVFNFGISDLNRPQTLSLEARNDKGEMGRTSWNIYPKYKYKEPVKPTPDNPVNDPDEGGTGLGGTGSGGSGISPNKGGVNNSIDPIIEHDNGGSTSDTNGTVTVSMTVTDENGAPISDLAMELHSAPKRGKTDSSGNVKFDAVEFGRHTIYITDPDTGKKITKVFTIKSGEDTEKDGNVITAEPGGNVSLSIRYDGKKISIMSAENIQAGTGMNASPDSGRAVIPVVAVILMLGAAAAFAVKRRHNA